MIYQESLYKLLKGLSLNIGMWESFNQPLWIIFIQLIELLFGKLQSQFHHQLQYQNIMTTFLIFRQKSSITSLSYLKIWFRVRFCNLPYSFLPKAFLTLVQNRVFFCISFFKIEPVSATGNPYLSLNFYAFYFSQIMWI